MSWPKAVRAWLLIVVAESIHGAIRQFFIARVMGGLPARQIGILVGSAIVFAIAWAWIRWISAASLGAQVRMGLAWVVVMTVFELGVNRRPKECTTCGFGLC
jgi:hypothetical protein